VSPVKYEAVNLAEKYGRFADQWSPRVIAALNDYQVKLAKIQGEFVWHDHAETDELFLVVKGEMTIELRDGSVTLREGELFVVPKGVEHKPYAEEECHLLLIEPRGVVNTGETASNLTAAGDRWV